MLFFLNISSNDILPLSIMVIVYEHIKCKKMCTIKYICVSFIFANTRIYTYKFNGFMV